MQASANLKLTKLVRDQASREDDELEHDEPEKRCSSLKRKLGDAELSKTLFPSLININKLHQIVW